LAVIFLQTIMEPDHFCPGLAEHNRTFYQLRVLQLIFLNLRFLSKLRHHPSPSSPSAVLKRIQKAVEVKVGVGVERNDCFHTNFEEFYESKKISFSTFIET
jgi:hypothetical protein